MRAKAWLLLAQVVLSCSVSLAFSETVVEAWRNPFGVPRAVSVVPEDGSVWAGMGSSVIHLSATGEVLCQTNGFLDPCSIAVKSTGDLCWVADAGRGLAVKLGEHGNELRRAGGFSNPQAVALDPITSNCYVADTGHNQVVCLSPVGEELWRVGGFLEPSALAARPADGSVWVADTGHDQVVLLSPAGTEYQRTGGFAGPVTLSMGLDGTCWVAEAERVTHLAHDGDVLSQTPGFSGPLSLAAVAATDSCWVADTGHGQVVRLNPSGVEVFRGGDLGTPVAIGADPVEGSCWVMDRDTNRLVQLTATGTPMLVVPVPGWGPVVTATAGDGSVWASVWYQDGPDTLVHFAEDGTVLASIPLVDPPLSISPFALAVEDDDGSIWLTQRSGDDMVAHLSGEGALIARSAAGTLGSPQSISVPPGADEAWVTSTYTGEVLRLDRGCQVTARYSGFVAPTAVSVDGDGGAWVADGGANRVVHLDTSGAELGTFTGYATPAGIAANREDGSVWVGDTMGRRLVHQSADGGILWEGDDRSGPGPVYVSDFDGSCCATPWYGPGNFYLLVSAEGVELWRGNPVYYRSRPGALGSAHAPAPTRGAYTTYENFGFAPDGSFWIGKPVPMPAFWHLARDGKTLLSEQGYRRPQSVSVVESDGSVWVAETGAARLLLLGADGTVVATAAAEGLEAPAIVAVDQTDASCWAADPAHSLVVLFASSGEEAARWTSITSPIALVANSHDRSAWAIDSATNEVVHLGAAGAEAWRGGAGLIHPTSICVNTTDGSVWAADPESGIAHLGVDGALLRTVETVLRPMLVAVNSTDHSIWVVTAGDGRLSHLDQAGALLATGGLFPSAASLSVNTADNSLWVADGGGSVAHVAEDGTELWRSNEFLGPTSVSVNAVDGTAWIAEPAQGQVAHLAIAPTVDFEATPRQGVAPLTVTFTDTSSADAVHREWDFGDGTTATEQHPVHVYEEVGLYTVALTARNALAGDTKTKVDYILVGTGPIGFSATPTVGTAPLDVAFTDLSLDYPTAWTWQFGDGATSDQRNPVHRYADIGGYSVTLSINGAEGPSTITRPRYLLVTFPDVPAEQWALRPIIACVDAHIVQGYPNGNYQPDLPVTRDQMAVYLSRALAGGDTNVPTGPSEATFPDMPTDHWAFRYVEFCADQTIVQGYPDGGYRPEEAVDRGQMAVYMARASATPTGDAGVPDAEGGPTFPDVTPDNDWAWCYRYVEYCAAATIVHGYPDGSYHPELVVTRDQMAAYVQRAFELPM